MSPRIPDALKKIYQSSGLALQALENQGWHSSQEAWKNLKAKEEELKWRLQTCEGGTDEGPKPRAVGQSKGWEGQSQGDPQGQAHKLPRCGKGKILRNHRLAQAETMLALSLIHI